MPTTVKPFSPTMIKRACFHEAGHAVVNHYFGYSFAEIVVYDRRDAAGCGGKIVFDQEIEIKHRVDSIIKLAGVTAECRAIKRRIDNVTIWLESGISDMRGVTENAEEIVRRNNAIYGLTHPDAPGLDCKLVYDQWQHETTHIIDQCWEAIERVATKLIDTRHMTYSEFLAVTEIEGEAHV